jgi:excinuclease ABC subunit A
VVAVGTPEDVAATPSSYTGQYLKLLFDRRRKAAGGKRATTTQAAE